MLSKRLMVVNGLTAEERPVQVRPGVTAREVLSTLGLPTSYNLSRVRGRRVFRDGADLFPVVENCDRLYAFAPMEVGWPGRDRPSLLYRFGTFLQQLGQGRRQDAVPMRPVEPVQVIHPREIRVVQGSHGSRPRRHERHPNRRTKKGWRPCRPYWQVRHWRQTSQYEFVGYFHTPAGRIKGVCRFVSRTQYSFHLYHPPDGLLLGPHGACFNPVGRNRYNVHFATAPQDVNTAIYYLETLLTEAFRR